MTRSRFPVHARRLAQPSPQSLHDAAKPRLKRRAARREKAAEAVVAAANIDGAWVLTSVGTPCGSSSDTVVISSGKMVGQYGTAQVSPNGGVSGTGSAGSLSWTMSGRFSGRSGSGTFRRSDGCAGSWSGSKQ